MLITSSERRRRILRDELWYQGKLRYLIKEKRPNAQLSLYDWIHGWKGANPGHPGPLCLTTRRRLGKTHLIGTLSVERAIRYPNQIVKVGSPYYKQTKEIMTKILPRVLRDCPGNLRPERSGSTLIFKNPRWGDPYAVSEIGLVGVNTDRGDRLRGSDLDMGFLDEVRDIKDLAYIQNDILWPQFLGRDLPLLVYTTTEPRTQAHDYVTTIRSAARREGRARTFKVANLDRDPMTPPDPEEDLDWTIEAERLVLASGVTKGSATWRREYGCEEVPDLESLIVPEFVQVENEVVYRGSDYTEAHKGRPGHFNVFMGGDFAWDDNTALLWAFHDFDEDLLVIEAEIVRNRTTPKKIAELIRDQEKRLYPEHYAARQIVRFADAPALTLAGLTEDEKVPILPPEKVDRDEAIAKLRTRFAEKKIRISERCQELRYQLRNGIWDDKRKDFIRSTALGHCDCIAALIYLNRMAWLRANPHPIGKPPRSEKFHPSWDPAPGPAGAVVTDSTTLSHAKTLRGGPNPFR